VAAEHLSDGAGVDHESSHGFRHGRHSTTWRRTRHLPYNEVAIARQIIE
jgi:hypothetical protein